MPPPCGMPWEEVTGAVASSGQARDKVLECLWQELLSLGVVVAADLLCVSRQPVPVSTPSMSTGLGRGFPLLCRGFGGMLPLSLFSPLSLHLDSPYWSPCRFALGRPTYHSWRLWGGYKHPWEGGESSILTLTAPFPP